MKIVLAPNAFKGSATATTAAAAMARGVRAVLPECDVIEVPVADGGDGLDEVLRERLGGEACPVIVTGPSFEPIEAGYVYIRARNLAVIEMARASGLALLEGQPLDPTRTTTLGTGELIRAALDRDVERLIVGIGGSATNDGGVGAASALGWSFLDDSDRPVRPVGGSLGHIARLDADGRDERLEDVVLDVICDVDNPLCGPRGAAAIYGPQKGATSEQVRELDAGLAHLADLAAAMGPDRRDDPGAGAAGGLGFGLCVFAGGVLRRGTDVIFELLELDHHLQDADLVMTGEGRIDEQTAMGKAPGAVAARARAHGVPCVAICGSAELTPDATVSCGFAAVHTIARPGQTEADSMADVVPNLERAAALVARTFASSS